MINILCLIATEDRLWNMKRALRKTQELYPNLIEGHCFSVWDIAANPDKIPSLLDEIKNCDFGIVYFHGGVQTIPDFDSIWKALIKKMPVYFESSLPDEVAQLLPESGLSAEEYRNLQKYFGFGGEENLTGMLIYIAAKRFGANCNIPEPVPPLDEGFYYHGKILSSEECTALKCRAAEHKAPVVGLILQHSQIMSKNTRHICAVLDKLDELGAVPLPLFTRMANNEDEQLGIRHAMERYFTYKGEKLPNVILVMAGFSMTHMSWPGDGSRVAPCSIFEGWNVPALQVMTTRLTKEDYENTTKGIDNMSITNTIFQPELDGQIITVPCACQKINVEDGIERKVYIPIDDRVDRVCRLALNWAKLSIIAPQQKKVAILFNTMHGNAKLGCAEGLDSFESVYEIVKSLQKEGIYTEYDFKDGQDIAKRITAGLTNDIRWISEDEMAEKAVASANPSVWKKWYDKCSNKVKAELKERWNDAPGEYMTEDDTFLFPGIINGNIFIGLQPSRAFDEQAEELFHSTDSVPPYSYIAYYRYLEDIFKANIIYHVGTHGTVEWLPGKEVGLSHDCYGDICLGNLPHMYPYHIGITGEGIQAKRRSGAVIIDHMPPSLDEAGVYEDLAVIDEALKEYYQAKQFRPAQIPDLEKRIFELAEKSNMTKDLHITKEDFDKNSAGVINSIHIWMGELKNSVVKDGLHVLGKVPKGKLYENMLRTLVRVKNGNIPSLNDSILVAQGYNPEEIKNNPTDDFNGLSGLSVYDNAINTAKRITEYLSQRNYQSSAINKAIESENFADSTADLKNTLTFMCEIVCDKLNHITDEMTNLIAGTNGKFVPPSLGGNPTRGNVDILPTGRNFYASDPNQIPSRAAWEIGKVLAHQVLDEYSKQNSDYPESIAMVVWAGNTIKTCGEDFAECLYLLGVRPVYLGESTRVIGVEPIPLEELKRPRLDITLRISGLFRDMYPNLISLMDKAINCVAALDEPDEQNYIRKHIKKDMENLMNEGLSKDDAKDMAYARIYGCAPGCYGTGVAKVIDSRQWSDFKDLAKVFETWSSYAYTEKSHGEKRSDMFKKRMSTVSVTIKNESNVEYDMLSSDDFYGYHGGLVACVKANSGKNPLALTGHTDNPEHPVTRDINKETSRIVRSRILNPKWLEGLKRHGFKGAQEIVVSMDHLFGWDATADAAEDWMYQEAAEKFLFDDSTRKWMESANKWSVHSLSERLLEANKRGMWNTDEQTIKKLQKIYMQAEGTVEENL